MAVSALHVLHLAEHAVLRHVECVELKEVVAAVLKHHHVETLLLTEVDKLPDLVKVHGRRHLNGNILAMLKSVFGYGEMVQPVGSDINEVDVFPLAQLFVTLITIIHISGRQACLL